MNPLELRVRHALDDLRALSRAAKETALTETVRRIHDEQEQFIAHTLRTLATELQEQRVSSHARRLRALPPLTLHGPPKGESSAISGFAPNGEPSTEE